MKLSDLKRLPVGTKLLLVNCLMGPVPEDKQYREVAEVKSNAIKFKFKFNGVEKFSYLYFSKNSFRDDGDGFTIFDNDGYGGRVLAAQYKFMKS